MKTLLIVALIMSCSCSSLSEVPSSELGAQVSCGEQWYRDVEEVLHISDAQAHGPDLGSEEWRSAVEFKLHLGAVDRLPTKNSQQWCDYIASKIQELKTETKPSFCVNALSSSIEEMICRDATYWSLDRKLSEVYAMALSRAVNEHPRLIEALQRGWVKGRNECWKEEDKPSCIRDAYVRRIAELQAQYSLVSFQGPIFYFCNGNPADEFVVTFFETDPPTLIAERGDSVSLMFLQESGSGTKYQGRNESFWEHQGEATFVWGYQAAELVCQKK